MAPAPEARRLHPRRTISGVEVLCYRTSVTAAPQLRRNIGQGILDISPGGARVRVLERVQKGDQVTFELKDLSTGEAFRARGQVRWCAPDRSVHLAGLQFSEIYTPIGRREKFTVGAPAAPAFVPVAPASTLEKRLAPRFEVDDYIVTCLKQGALSSLGLKRNLARAVHNISRKGVQIALSDPLDAGDLVLFTLHLNKFADTLECQGEVRWCRPDSGAEGSKFSAGIQFLNLPDDKRKMIDFMRGWFTSYQHRHRREQRP